MKASEIRTLPVEQIQETLKIQKEEYQQMRFNNGLVSLKSPIELRHVRKTIARLETVLHEKKQ